MFPQLDNSLSRPDRLFKPGQQGLTKRSLFLKGFTGFLPRRAFGPRRPGVSSYRVFMTLILVFLVFVDQWCDRHLSVALCAVVGPASAFVWLLTLVGSFEIGPVAAIWLAISQ
ncbi:MAG: hypothetical protein H7274_24640 [Rhodoferax sp.]|nr:hypothetical protein [Rhodoferax sp.]